MPATATIRAALLLLGLSAAASAQTLPANPPSTPGLYTPPAAQLPSLSPTGPHHLQVLYAKGLLSIHAENSSLNAILRDISRQTGMQITGGVSDERVYGNYGPADTGAVLVELLAGTGSNLLLKESTGDRPLELVLTPRQGGASPPSPQVATRESEDDDTPPQQTRPTPPGRPLPGYAPMPATSSINDPVPPREEPLPDPTPAATQATPSTSPSASAAAGTTTQQSPNGVKTPQQIYDQLMQLKQQQSNAATASH